MRCRADGNMLRDKGVLGSGDPDTLRDTILFLLGLHLALRGGKEHKDLCSLGFNYGLSVKTDGDGVKFLLFNEDTQRKTNRGSLTSRKKSQGRTMKIYGIHTLSALLLVCLRNTYLSCLQMAKTHRCTNTAFMNKMKRCHTS